MERIDKINIECKNGFHFEVQVKHHPNLGISTAYYNENVIACREYGKIHEPMSDNDHEWEMYEERLDKWAADAITDLTPECTAYFNVYQ